MIATWQKYIGRDIKLGRLITFPINQNTVNSPICGNEIASACIYVFNSPNRYIRIYLSPQTIGL